MQGARPILYGAKLGLPLTEEQILPQVWYFKNNVFKFSNQPYKLLLAFLTAADCALNNPRISVFYAAIRLIGCKIYT